MFGTLFENEYSEVIVLNSSQPDYVFENEWMVKVAETNMDADDIATHFMSVGDVVSALKFYLICAEKGNKVSQNSVGWCYQMIGDQEKAFFWFQESAKQNYHLAQYEVGMHFLAKKEGVKAFHWLLLAAKQGHSLAQYEVAMIYRKTTAEHREWLRCAAENNHIEAQYKYGCLIETENYDEAFRLFSKASSNGHISALWKVAMYFFNKESYKMAAYCFRKLLNRNCDQAAHYLEICVQNTKADPAKYYMESAKAGNIESLRSLGLPITFENATFHCCVCLETVTGGLKLKCNHLLCCECSYGISKSAIKRCPMCRGDFN